MTCLLTISWVHEIEQHPITSWHEEEDAVPENMISDILIMETPNLEMMLNEDFIMDLLTGKEIRQGDQTGRSHGREYGRSEGAARTRSTR